MPMYDMKPFIEGGIPVSKNILKYSNMVDQNGAIVTPNARKFNLDYNSLYIIMKEQNRIETLERYMWFNVPFGLTADIIERVLFYRGKGILYFNDKVEKFQFLPFALNKTIDEYGRYTACNTLPFTGVSSKEEKGKKNQTLIYENLEIVYDLPYNKEMLESIRKNKVVGIILNDSSLGVGQSPIIRSNYVEPVLHLLATIIQLINTAIYGCADHSLLQVENESEYDSVMGQIEAINKDILNGNRFTPIVGKLPITPLKTSNTADIEGLFNTFNSINNFLKSITGIPNAGIFDKKAHLLQEEQDLNSSNADYVYDNGLRMRQEFCLMVQAYYGYPIWCESKKQSSIESQSPTIIGNSPEQGEENINNDIKGEEESV